MSSVVLVTGCSRGLGKLLVETLASKGFIVYAGVRKQEDVRSLQSLWQDGYSDLCPVKLDITIEKDCKEAVEKIVAKQGRLDILINNAAFTLAGPTVAFSTQEYLDVLNTNAVGAFRLIRLVVPQMQVQKSGRIINITSLNGLLSLPHFSLYSSSKFALEALGLGLRQELKAKGIWVTNIAPGAIRRKGQSAKKLPHRPAREKFGLLGKLMPMTSQEKVVGVIERVISDPGPPARVIVGRDAQLTTFFQRFLPSRVWEFLLDLVWKS